MSSSELPRILFLCSGNYYRSRFAEELFNHYAVTQGARYRADSAGLWPNCPSHNVGPMSPLAIRGLQERGVTLPRVLRSPRDVSEADLQSSLLTIAVKELEHRPLLHRRFPAWATRVEFWQVDDVADAPPSVALPMLEQGVNDLLGRLTGRR